MRRKIALDGPGIRGMSVKEWGWTSPALLGEDGGLIAGHARVLAARQLGITEIPVMVAAGWSEAQKRACVLADNQLAITGSGWDPELLRLELGELKLSGFDLSLTGFGDLELKDLMTERTAGLTDPDGRDQKHLALCGLQLRRISRNQRGARPRATGLAANRED